MVKGEAVQANDQTAKPTIPAPKAVKERVLAAPVGDAEGAVLPEALVPVEAASP